MLEYVLDAFRERSWTEFVMVFWFFFFIDGVRNVLMDFVLVAHVLKRSSTRYTQDKANAERRIRDENPLVSIIVPGKNEGRHIPNLVRSLANQTYLNFEVIVVDDGSDDDTEAICRDLERSGKITLFLRNEVRGGKASAANLALRYSKGKYILHLDADTHLQRDALEKILLPCYLDSRIGAVAGNVRVANLEESLTSGLQAIEYIKGISVGRVVHSTLGTLRIVSGAFGLFPREALLHIGGWDVGPGLDGDLTQKLRKAGYLIQFEPDAICFTHVPATPSKLAKQRFRWDRSLVRFRVRRHADIFSANANFKVMNFVSSAENVFFSIALNANWWAYFIYALVFSSYGAPVLLVINYILYVVANFIQLGLACSLQSKTMRREEWKLFALIPLTPLYVGLLLRTVRTYAYLMEFFFRVSYHDSWNPWKVSKAVLEFEKGKPQGAKH